MEECTTIIQARTEEAAARIMEVMLDHESRELARGYRSLGNRKIQVELFNDEPSRPAIEPEADSDPAEGPELNFLRRKLAVLSLT